MTAPSPSPRTRAAVLTTLALLYIAQGIPFGFAAEYLPVVLRQAHYTRTQIAALGWLQIPWYLKIAFAHLGDAPAVRRHARAVLLAIQLGLAVAVAAYAPFDVRNAPLIWFALTALCALFAATQDIFVDALAVRSLAPRDRGYGNVAQVAGYRLGMLAGGAGLLLLVGTWGQPRTMLACAAVIAFAGAGAFVLRADRAVEPAHREARVAWLEALREILRHVCSRETWPVLALAVTFKLGPHVAGTLIKPMVVDAHWTSAEIGRAVVTVGTAAGLLGAALGGWFYRVAGERGALAGAAVMQSLVCAPLAIASAEHAPHALTTVAIATEHFASGLGTTVLFAALMTATRPSSAALHYTVLTSANALALGLGSMLGGALGDSLGEVSTFALAAIMALGPLALLPRWRIASQASAAEPAPQSAPDVSAAQ